MNANNDSPLQILPYPGDHELLTLLEHAPVPFVSRVWEEPHTCVVLGKGNKEEQELHYPHILEDRIQVYRREGGGGSVVLSPGMLIIAVAAHVNDPFGSKRFFHTIQSPIIDALTLEGIPHINQRGISDLAQHDRKILGSSMRRKASILLYQAVLLVDVQREIFAHYLQHPPKEPEYREGRDHQSFTISLRELGFQGSLPHLQQQIQTQLNTQLPILLKDEFAFRS